MPPTNSQQITNQIFNDLNEEEISMLNDCMENIRKHVDQNIRRSKDAGQLARLLVFRRLLTNNKV